MFYCELIHCLFSMCSNIMEQYNRRQKISWSIGIWKLYKGWKFFSGCLNHDFDYLGSFKYAITLIIITKITKLSKVQILDRDFIGIIRKHTRIMGHFGFFLTYAQCHIIIIKYVFQSHIISYVIVISKYFIQIFHLFLIILFIK